MEITHGSIIGNISEDFVSFSLDFSQIIGKDWWSPKTKKNIGLTGKFQPKPLDFSDERFKNVLKPLLPTILRIGGTKADQIYYAISSKNKPPGYKDILDMKIWNKVLKFANEMDMKLFVNINAGKGPRDKKGLWEPSNANEFINYNLERTNNIIGYEFGNEPNILIVNRKKPSGKRYARDFAVFLNNSKKIHPSAIVSGAASAFWPYVGEFFCLTKDFLKHLKDFTTKDLDVLSWHYYPLLSSRAPIATR